MNKADMDRLILKLYEDTHIEDCHDGIIIIPNAEEVIEEAYCLGIKSLSLERELILNDISEELSTSMVRLGKFNSSHEGYAMILEEVRELEREVFKRKIMRDERQMMQEAKQVAAMAIRFMMDLS